jgi:hypothetical protein
MSTLQMRRRNSGLLLVNTSDFLIFDHCSQNIWIFMCIQRILVEEAVLNQKIIKIVQHEILISVFEKRKSLLWMMCQGSKNTEVKRLILWSVVFNFCVLLIQFHFHFFSQLFCTATLSTYVIFLK